MTRPDFVVLGIMGESGSGKDFSAAWVIRNENLVRVGFADVLKRFLAAVFEFSDESLWGEPKLRNLKVFPCLGLEITGSSDFADRYWRHAEANFLENVDDFVNDMPLSTNKKAEYKKYLGVWFDECRDRADRGLISPRLVLQLLGTEYGRGFKKTMWSDYLFERIVPRIEQGHPYGASSGIRIVGLENIIKTDGIVIPDARFITEIKAIQNRGGYVIKIVRLAHKDKENEAEKAGITGHASEAEQRGIPNEAYDLVLEMGEGSDHVYPRLKKMFEEKEWEIRRSQSRRGKSTEPGPNAKEPTGGTPES